MSEWKEYKLGDLTNLVNKGTTPSSLGGKFVDKGINYIKSEAVGYNGRIDKTTFVCIDEAMHQKLKRSQLAKDDILFSMAGIFLGKNALVPEDVLPANTNQALAIIRLNQQKANPKFIHYYLRQRSVIDFVNNMSGQSAQPNINFEEIKSIDILLPELSEQIQIATLLSSLDDKIDLLHCQNKTLEQLAETIFRQWFVEEAEESWEETTLGKFIQPKKGKNITKTEAIEGEFPVVAGGLEPSCYHNEANTIAPVITISASGANAGFVRLYNNPVWSSDSSYIDQSITPFIFFFYVFLKFSQKILFDKQEGSAQPHIYPSHIMELDMLNYPKKLIETFENEFTSMFQKIKSNTNQIRTLTQLRDTLLPKFMSGEVRVEN